MQSEVTAQTKAIGQAVRAALVQAGFTQETASDPLRIPLSTLSRRINGALPFTYPELVRVAAVTGVSVGELVASAERILSREQPVAS